MDLNMVFSKGVLYTEDALLQAIMQMDYDAECAYTRKHIKEEFVATYGNATEKALEVIVEKMQYE